jgi:hypothetical protein
VLASLRARRTPKHVLASCSGFIEWSRDMSRELECIRVLCATCCARAGITTTVLRREALFASLLVISFRVTDGRASCGRAGASSHGCWRGSGIGCYGWVGRRALIPRLFAEVPDAKNPQHTSRRLHSVHSPRNTVFQSEMLCLANG